MENLDKRILHIIAIFNKIRKAYKDYYDIIEKIGFTGAMPFEAESIHKFLETVPDSSDLSKLWRGYHDSAKFDQLLSLMDKFSSLVMKYREVNQQWSKFTPNIDYSNFTSSGTSISEGAIQAIGLGKAKIAELFLEIETHLSKDLYTSVVETIKDIGSLDPNKYKPENLDFWAVLLQTILDQHGDKATVVKIMKHTESLKNTILGNSTRESVPTDKDPVIQRLIQTLRLVPVEPMMPLEELLKSKFTNISLGKLVSVTGPPLIAYLTGIAKKAGISMIVIINIGPRPLLHLMRLLIDKNYVAEAGLTIIGKEGVSSKYLEATRTLQELEMPKANKMINEIHVIGEGSETVILETLDNVSWRYLTPWNNLESDSIKIPSSWFAKLTDPQACPSKRVESYNAILETEVVNKISIPITSMEQLTRSEVMREDLHWKNLRQKIRREAMPYWKAITKGSKSNPEVILGKLAQSNYYDRLINIITNQIAFENMEGVWWQNLEQYKRDYIMQELILTHSQGIAKIRNNLRQTAENEYKKLHKPSSKADEVWDVALEESLQKFINKKSSLYTSLENKLDIMKKCII